MCVRQSGAGRSGFDSVVEYRYSANGGESWTAPTPISEAICHGSQLARSRDGRLTVTWFDLETSELKCRISEDDGASFEAERVVCPVSLNEGCRAPGDRPGQHPHFDPRYRCGEQVTRASMAVDRSGGPRDGWLYVVWPEAVSGVLDPELPGHIVESEPNDSLSLSTPVMSGEEFCGVGRGAAHGLFDMDYFGIPVSKGETLSLTGRTLWYTPDYPGIETSCVVLQMLQPRPGRGGAAGYVQLESQGVSPALLMTARESGTAFVEIGGSTQNFTRAYCLRIRKLTPDPGSVARDHRDIVMVASPDGGRTWTDKVLVNDGPIGYDESAPVVTVDRFGAAHVAWYDQSEDLARGLSFSVRGATTTDGGRTMTPSRRISRGVYDWTTDGKHGELLGDYFVFQAEGDSLYGMWTGYGENTWLQLVGRVMPIEDLAGMMSRPMGVRLDGSVRVSCELSGKVPSGQVGLWRRTPGEAWTLVQEREVAGAGSYGFADAGPPAAAEYRILLSSSEGMTAFSEPVPGMSLLPDVGGGPAIVLLRNPARGVVSFRVLPMRAGPVSVAVFDVAGRRLRRYALDQVPVEGTLVSWDRRDGAGRPVAAGRYFVRVEAEGKSRSEAVTLVD